ncbi:MAG: AhpC/TSA family protein [Duncaniella sp.]|nr:AhpC/TSA family protein [Duncaniella sp.]
MKIRNLLSAMMLCVAASVSAAPFEYLITGDLKSSESDGRKAYMMLYDTNQLIDSAVISEGRFAMKGLADKSGMVRIDVDREYANLILSPGETVVDFDNHVPLSGDSLNMALRDYFRKANTLVDISRDIRHGMDARKMSADSLALFNKEMQSAIERIYLEFNRTVLYDNPDNPLGEIALRSFASYTTPGDWFEIYSGLSPYLLSLKFTDKWNAKMKKAVATDKGAMFRDIEGRTVNGSVARLSDYLGKGKYVLVDFWASWCGPCRQEGQTTLKPLYEKYGSDPRFEILGVAVWDDPTRSISAIQSEGYGWPQIIDVGMKPMEEYGFDGIPMIMLFAPDGTIAARNIRGAEIWKTVESVLK